MTARIKTQEEADLQAAVKLAEAEYDALTESAERVRQRLVKLRTLLYPERCGFAFCKAAVAMKTRKGDES